MIAVEHAGAWLVSRRCGSWDDVGFLGFLAASRGSVRAGAWRFWAFLGFMSLICYTVTRSLGLSLRRRLKV